MSYSLFTLDKTNISSLVIASDHQQVLGITNKMFKLKTHYYLTKQTSINSSYIYIAPRFPCVNDVNFICGLPKKLSAEHQLKLFYRLENNRYSVNLGFQIYWIITII